MPQVTIGAAYIRVSTDDQTELSPDAQLRVILERSKSCLLYTSGRADGRPVHLLFLSGFQECFDLRLGYTARIRSGRYR